MLVERHQYRCAYFVDKVGDLVDAFLPSHCLSYRHDRPRCLDAIASPVTP